MTSVSGTWAEPRLQAWIVENVRDPIVVIEGGEIASMNKAARALSIDLEALFADESATQIVHAAGLAEVATGAVHVLDANGRSRRLEVEAARQGDSTVVTLRETVDAAAGLDRETLNAVHDFNNLLTAMHCSCMLLDREVDPGTPAASIAAEVRLTAQRASSVVRKMLGIERRKKTRATKAVDVDAALLGVRSLICRIVGERVEVAFDLRAGRARARVQAEELDQLLLNLAANARDAMPSGGRLIIATERISLGELEAYALDCPRAGTYVAITISDSGAGMAPDVREHMFDKAAGRFASVDRFFTTTSDHGSGVGLSSGHRFVMESGGTMSVRTTAGAGTTLVVYLPIQAAAVRAVTPPPQSARLRGAETILVVSSETSARDDARTILEALGYFVLEASSNEQALHVAARHEGAIDLFLVDQPAGSASVDGTADGALAEALRAIGRPAHVLSAMGAEVSPLELARRVRQTLDPQAPP